MPVLGHAFVGIALGVWTRPISQGVQPSPLTSARAAVWTPLVIILSYLPDIISQTAIFFGYIEIRQIAHALPSAAVLSLVATPILMRSLGTSVRRTYFVIFTALAIHDLLDVVQATDRMLWWPFSCHPVWREKSLIPTTPLKEAILFGFPSLLVVIIRYAISSYQILSPDSQTSSQTSRQELFLWCVNITTTAILLGIAAMTNHLRQTREAQLERARQSSHVNHRYKETLLLLNEAERWPSTAKPGRIDYLRGWTYSQLGDRKQAEDYYLRSLRADPSYFWAVADLAYFYASAPERREVRQSKVKPYLNRLQEEFVHHPHLSETLDTITRALEHPR